MASRIFTRLRFVNRPIINHRFVSFSSRYAKSTSMPAVTGLAMGSGLLAYLMTRKTMPVVNAKAKSELKVEESIPLGLKQVAGMIPEPMATNTAGPCRQRKQQEDGKPVQPNVTSCMKEYSLFLWVSLKPTANPCATIKAAANVQCVASELDDCKCPEDNIIAGVGFGPNFWSQVMGKTNKNYHYTVRKGRNGEMPSTGGDIFVHAKCDSRGKLFEFCQNFLRSLPADSIEDFEDIYGFTFQDGRDLSGFLVNLANPPDRCAKKEVACECETGGSYALAQKWVHDLAAIEEAGVKKLECYIGRSQECGVDNPSKPSSSHVARMNGGTQYQCPPPVEILRQSMPYGHLCSETGIVYLAFANDPNSFEFLLDRMIGASCDGGHDDVMKFSSNVKGSYLYFPGMCELKQLMGQT